jgi:hypothetical protein
LKTQIFGELLTYMLQDPHTIKPALDVILISRSSNASTITRLTSRKMFLPFPPFPPFPPVLPFPPLPPRER